MLSIVHAHRVLIAAALVCVAAKGVVDVVELNEKAHRAAERVVVVPG